MQWWMTRRVERQASRMHEVMERLNVDGAALARLRQGQAYADARTRCLACGTSDKCLRWLDRQPLSSAPPEFCPNLGLFERYRKPQAHRLGNPIGANPPRIGSCRASETEDAVGDEQQDRSGDDDDTHQSGCTGIAVV
jgi:hypothetical protein